MTTLWFSRVTLKDDARINAIASLLLPDNQAGEQAAPLDPRHKLIWSLFADAADRERDFLWRADKYKTFYTLSERPPANDMFDIESKSYDPVLQKGDKLIFSLRANPIVRRKIGEEREVISKVTGIKRLQGKVKKIDVVMEQLRPLKGADLKGGEESERQAARETIIQQAGQSWLVKQGQLSGFELINVKCDAYTQHIIPRKNKSEKDFMKFSTVDYEGVLEVTEPEIFLKKLTEGFGSAKAYGCGLMLIKRA